MSGSPGHVVAAAGRTLELGVRPWLMGIVNASPDSFSDAGAYPDLDARVALGRELIAAGADILDVGGESGITLRPRRRGRRGDRARRAARSNARRPSSGRRSRSTPTSRWWPRPRSPPARSSSTTSAGCATRCSPTSARGRARRSCSCTRARRPSSACRIRGLYDDVTADVLDFLAERIGLARSRGVRDEQLIVDPGPDFAKTPAQTIELLRPSGGAARAWAGLCCWPSRARTSSAR